MTVRRPPMRYHGGKWLLAPWIISHFPRHRIYVEPFGGGASVLLRKPRAYAEVYNDAWGEVVNVFRVLRDPEQADRLRQLIELTPYARDEFQATYDAPPCDPIEAARLTIFRSMAGFGSGSVNGKHQTGFRSNSNRSGTTPAHDWANYPAHIEQFTDRLRGVVIESRDACEVINAHDNSEALFYVDPPYPLSTRNSLRASGVYAEEMADSDHEQLAEVLRKARGMVVLSSYPSELYDRLYEGWQRIERAALADGARKRVEVLWLNPAAAKGQPQARLIG
jgi:DNA adenine methylase